MKLVNSEQKIGKPLVWLEINKEKLLNNVDQIQQFVKPSKIMAVLKGNAYGLGLVPIAKAIEKEVDAFGVVGIKEAIDLREDGITKPVVNLGIYSFEDAKDLVKNKICPAIFTSTAFQDFESISKKLNTVSSIWIKVDTGLGRLGVPWQEAFEFIRSVSQSKDVRIEGIVSALTEDEEFDRTQLTRFLALREECQNANIQIPIWSLGSSESVFLFPEANLDMVRVGISLLGYYPSPTAKDCGKIELQPIVSFKTKVACIKKFEKGESIFYRRTFRANKETRIATLLPGYSYGIDTRCINGCEVLIGEQRYPLVGGISITNCFADIENNTTIKAGDEAVIFGKQGKQEIPLEEVCSCVQQNEYEFLSRIPEKVERIHR